MKSILSSFLVILSSPLWAQFNFKEAPNIEVTGTNGILSLAMAGGINAAQYQKMDLNSDGVEDLVLFDRTTNKITTFLGQENSFHYAPDYSPLFPEGITNWMELRDFDCDGDKDIFTSSIFGIKVYENLGFNAGVIQWTLVQDPINTQGFSTLVNLQMNATDIPAIEDIDQDGDLDILVFDFAGSGGIELHENQGGCGTFDYVRITKSWGEFKECFCNSYDFGSGCTDVPGGKLNHQVGFSVLVLDVDNDGDVDLLVGQGECETIDFMENKGSTTNALFDSFFKGYPLTNPVVQEHFPAPFYEDVDFDGVKDLLISTNSYSSTDEVINFSSTSFLYKNNGSNSLPDFELINNHFLQGDMIDLGENAYPSFFDLDGDGDLDMVLSSRGTFHPDGFYSTLHLYQNTGTESAPSFHLVNEDYASLSGTQLTSIIPYFIDMDSDGLSDLMFTGMDEFFQISLSYIHNSGSDGVSQFDSKNIDVVNLPLSAGDTPTFFDYNGDLLPDALVGKQSGALGLYVGDGSGNFSLVENNFLGVEGSPARRNISPAVSDLNNDGALDLVTSDSRGKIIIYSNFLSSSALPEPEMDWLENEVTGSFVPANYGANAHIRINNLLGSSSPDIIVGSALGGIQILENRKQFDPTTIDFEVRVFPNPVLENNKSELKIISNLDCTLEIFNLAGKDMGSVSGLKKDSPAILKMSAFLPGIYLLKFSASGQTRIHKIVVAD